MKQNALTLMVGALKNDISFKFPSNDWLPAFNFMKSFCYGGYPVQYQMNINFFLTTQFLNVHS